MVHKYVSPRTSPAKPVAGVAIVGIRGYSGLELARLLLANTLVELKAGFATDSTFALSDYLPEAAAASVPVLPMKDLEKVAAAVDTVFLATPAEVSLEIAPRILGAGANVIDLSGAFRLKTAAQYKEWYGLDHTALDLCARADYGLVPWAGPAQGAKNAAPKLIANPGCYATSVLMAVLPLLKAKLIKPETLVIDAKSGTTGAGRKAAENLLFTEVEGECLPYKVGKHQHYPEICDYVAAFSGTSIDPMFSTTLLPVRRGIISGIYARLAPGKTLADVDAAFAASYEGYPLVKHGAVKTSGKNALSLKQVAGSARTHIRYEADGEKLYVYSLIDNLMKGAASQAVENFNRLHDLAPGTSLMNTEGTL